MDSLRAREVRSASAGALTAVGWLLLFGVAFTAYLLAPLVALGVGAVAYALLRTRPWRTTATPATDAEEHPHGVGFGTGNHG